MQNIKILTNISHFCQKIRFLLVKPKISRKCSVLGKKLQFRVNPENKNEFFDKEGFWASRGEIIEPLLKHLMDDAYFRAPPPKSTGREYFNINWAYDKYSNLNSLNKTNVQTTFCEFTVTSILFAIEKLK